MVGLFRGRFVQRVLVPLLTAVSLLAAIGLTIWIWEPGRRRADHRGRADGGHARARPRRCSCLRRRARLPCCCRCASRRRARGRRRRVLLAAARLDRRHGRAGGRRDLITLFVGIELLSIPLYVLCATELRRRTSLEAGLKYLVIGSVGSATLLYGLALIYGATGATEFDAISDGDRARRGQPDRPAAADRHRADRHRARLQGVGGAVPPVDARRLPGRAHADHHLHGGGHQGGGVRRDPAAVRPRARARRSSSGRPRWPRWPPSRS